MDNSSDVAGLQIFDPDRLAWARDEKGGADENHRERVLQVIQNEVETKRIAVVRIETLEKTFVVLQQQEWAAGIGWFTQRSIELDADQLGPLRCTLQLCGDCRSKSNKKDVAATASRRGLGIVS